jgi:hypothetical protein
MDLLDPDHLGRLDPEVSEEATPVLLDRGRIVPDARPEVQGGIWPQAHPALPRTEGVHDSIRVAENLGLNQAR